MHLDSLNPAPIPSLMKSISRWVIWKPGKVGIDGKFAKYPVHTSAGYKVDAHNPQNQCSFTTAYGIASLQDNVGIGFVLNGAPVSCSDKGDPLYLIAIDIDSKSEINEAQLKELWIQLNKTYIEISPSKKGLRLFCLSKDLVENRNANGKEIYVSKRFLTVTGWEGKGNLQDCTKEIKAIHATWFPTKINAGDTSRCNYHPLPDTPRNRAWVYELLGYINPDCEYEIYRNVIWGIEYIGWTDCEDIGRKWSLGVPGRFSEDAFTVIRSSFDDRRGGITFGTLVHYAKLGGWRSAPSKQKVII